MRISLVGLGKSNFSLLRRICGYHELFVSERRKLSEEEIEELKRCGADYEVEHTERVLDSDVVVVSPGVSPLSEVGRMILEKSKRHETEVSMFFQLFKPSAKVVGVTGTNGKTTTTRMIAHFLEKKGFSVCLCGNNERPVSDLKEDVDFIVLELSSFQLFWSSMIPIDFGLLLNVRPDHMDWHGSFEDYEMAKLKIVRFSKVALVPPDYSSVAKTYGSVDLSLIPQHLRSSQNVENASAAASIIEEMGFDPFEFLDSLSDFTPPSHRMEFVGSIDGVDFFNDSKATNTHAVMKALENFDKVTLILSGILKERDLEEFKEFLRRKVEAVILLGEKIKEIGKLDVPTYGASTMEDAVKKALEVSSGVVLFSPGGASFDMYSNYEERGEDFKRVVREMIEGGI